MPENAAARAKSGLLMSNLMGNQKMSLFCAGIQCMAEHEYKRAARNFVRVIELDPDDPESYMRLALTLQVVGDRAGAAIMFVAALERFERGEHVGGRAKWCLCLAMAYHHLNDPSVCADKPSWWNDKDLLRLSEAAVATFAGTAVDHHMWRPVRTMRARVLFGAGVVGSQAAPDWTTYEVPGRSSAQLYAAQKSYLLASATDPDYAVDLRHGAEKCWAEAKIAEQMESGELSFEEVLDMISSGTQLGNSNADARRRVARQYRRCGAGTVCVAVNLTTWQNPCGPALGIGCQVEVHAFTAVVGRDDLRDECADVQRS